MKLSMALVASILFVLSCGDPGVFEIYSPEPSVLSAAASDSVDTIYLSWTRSTEDASGFDMYVLWRSESDSISFNTSTATMLAEISDQNDTTYTDDSLGWDSTFYYALVTESTIEGGQSWSNEVSATTPPQP